MDTRALLEEGWSAIVERFVAAIVTVTAGGSAGAWRSGLKSIAGTDYLNAVTGKPYRGAFNRATLSARLGPRLDRRVATARQLETTGFPHPASCGLASDAVILAPIAHRSREEEEDESAGRVTFRPACVYGVDRLRAWRGPNGERPWADLPPFIELPPAEWTNGLEDGALSLIPSLAEALGMRCETCLVKAPHVSFDGKEAIVRMPEPSQQEGTEEVMLANRLSSFFHEAAHWTGYGGAGETLRRTMTGDFGSADYAREELVGEISASRMLQLLGFEETDGFLEKKAAYVAGWAAPILSRKEETEKDPRRLIKGALEDVERIVAAFVEALRPNAFFAERLLAIEAAEAASRLRVAEKPVESEIPDWRDLPDPSALSPAQRERAVASWEAKKRKGATTLDFEAYVRRAQAKRAAKSEKSEDGNLAAA